MRVWDASSEEALSECADAVWNCYRKNFPNAPKIVEETKQED